MSAVFEIKIRLPYLLYKIRWEHKPLKKHKFHIPNPQGSQSTLCGINFSNPNYHTEDVISCTADLSSDLCLTCLSLAISRQRKIGNGSIPGGYYDQN